MRGPAPSLRWSLLFVLLTVPLSGCVGDDGGTDPVVEEPDGLVVVDPDTGERSVLYWSPAEFDIESPYHHVETEDGTFQVHQHDHPARPITDQAGHDSGNMHLRDISDKVPKGVPVRLSAEIQADLTHGDVDIWFNMPQDEMWTFQADAPRGGYTRIEMLVLHTSDDPIELVVWSDELENKQSFDYTLTYEITAKKEMLFAGIPVAVDVPRQTRSIEVEWNGTGGAVWLWAPDDTFIGRFATNEAKFNHTLSENAPSGEYILLLSQGSPDGWVTIYYEGEQPTAPVALRPIKQDIQQMPSQAIQANTPATYKFTSQKVPIQVGVQVSLSDFTKDLHFTLASPEGELLTGDFTSPTPLWTVPTMGSVGFFMMTTLGAERLAAGEYTSTFTGSPHGNGQMTAFLVYPIR